MGKPANISRLHFAALAMFVAMLAYGCDERSTQMDVPPAAKAKVHQSILVKKKTDDHFWTPRETPVLEDFPALAALPEDSLSKYGGWTGKRFAASGFFRTHKQDGVWWLVDPEGYAFFSIGLNSVEPGVESSSDEKKLKDRFFGAYPSVEDWSDKAQIWLGDTGFNTLGSWSDWKAMNDGERAANALYRAAASTRAFCVAR